MGLQDVAKPNIWGKTLYNFGKSFTYTAKFTWNFLEAFPLSVKAELVWHDCYLCIFQFILSPLEAQKRVMGTPQAPSLISSTTRSPAQQHGGSFETSIHLHEHVGTVATCHVHVIKIIQCVCMRGFDIFEISSKPHSWVKSFFNMHHTQTPKHYKFFIKI